MLNFLLNFTLEVALSIAFSCIFLMFTYKGEKWRIFSLAFLLVVTPLYLSQMDLVSIWMVVLSLSVIPFGVVILYKNIKASAYHLALNPSEKNDKKEKSTKNLSKRLNGFEKLNGLLLGAMFGLIIVVPFQEAYQILQIPLFLIGIISLFGIAIYFSMSDRNNQIEKLRLNLKTFLVVSYFIMGYSFLDLFLFLNTSLSFSLLRSLIFATLIIGIVFLLVEHALSMIQKSILVTERNRSLAKTYFRFYTLHIIIGLLLTLVFSDAPVVYGMFLEQDIGQMIVWTGPFFFFISFLSREMLRKKLEFGMQVGLLERKIIEDEFRKLSKIKWSKEKT
jgi:hypothetical protein